jgi:hypothetical protein
LAGILLGWWRRRTVHHEHAPHHRAHPRAAADCSWPVIL